MFLEYLWKGIIVGLSATIPLGPIGVLCIQRTLNKGRSSGIITGLGAATADVFYASLAGFGISTIINYLTEYQIEIRIVGAIVLVVLGYKLIVTNPGIQLRKQLRSKHKGLFGDFISSFALTLSNPITILYFIGIFAGFNIVNPKSNILSVFSLLIGTFLGAMLWWISLTAIVNIFRHKFKLRRLLRLNQGTGIFIILFAIFIFISIFFNSSLDKDNKILSFSIPNQIGTTMIDENKHQVNINVADTTDITRLIPTITVSDSAIITPNSEVEQDFSSLDGVKYTVKSKNGQEQVWTATVTKPKKD